jgi:hypothetical protein
MQPASVAIAALRKSAELGKDESLNKYRDNPATPISVIAANEAMQFPVIIDCQARWGQPELFGIIEPRAGPILAQSKEPAPQGSFRDLNTKMSICRRPLLSPWRQMHFRLPPSIVSSSPVETIRRHAAGGTRQVRLRAFIHL